MGGTIYYGQRRVCVCCEITHHRGYDLLRASEAASLHAHSNNAAFFLSEIASSAENSSLQFQSFGSVLLQVRWHVVGAAYARSRPCTVL